MKTKIILLFLGTFLLLLPVQSQVTIGSGIETRKGSLLELKEDNNAGVNSSKGFSLPRVKLNSASDLTVDDYSKRLEYKGLTVQNTNTSGGLTEGIYSWDGDRWKLIVAANGPGTEAQVLISKGPDNVPQWQDLAQVHVPSVTLFAKQTKSTARLGEKAYIPIPYDKPTYMNGFSYNETTKEFKIEKSGYYVVNVYCKVYVKFPNNDQNKTDGTLTTVLAIKNGNNVRNYPWEFGVNMWYGFTTTNIYQTASGLVYLEAGKEFAIISIFTRDSQIMEGYLSMTYMTE